MTITSLLCSGVFSAVSGFSGLSLSLSFSVGSSVFTNKIVFPFGDQSMRDAPRGTSVKGRASPPAKDRRYTWAGCGLSSFLEDRRKAKVLPSGDHRGELSRGQAVIWRGLPPPAAPIHNAVS